MSNALLESLAGALTGADRRMTGVVVGEVTSNTDSSGMGRVQVRIPWLDDGDVWARVAMPSAGKERGIYFIPQVGDEVLVAGAYGDTRELYVLGSLWNGQDSPPAGGMTDPVNKRIIKTPQGHIFELDDQEQKITITSASKHTVTIEPKQIEIAMQGGSAKLTMTSSGEVTLEGNVSITLKAPQIKLDGQTVEVKGSGQTTVKSSGVCTIEGSLVKIN